MKPETQSQDITPSQTNPSNIIPDKEKIELSPPLPQENFMTKNHQFAFSSNLKTIFLGGILFVAIIATVSIFSGDHILCLFSPDCKIDPPSVTGNLWAFLGGIAGYAIATTMGIPLLPAVGIAVGIWLLMQIS